MKKFILLTCLAAMTAVTSIQAGFVEDAHKMLLGIEAKVKNNPQYPLPIGACRTVVLWNQKCPQQNFKDKYSLLYARADAIIAQNSISTRCMGILKTLAHKGGAQVARFISAGLKKIKDNPKTSIALATAVALPALVYGAAQLCVTLGATASILGQQPISAAISDFNASTIAQPMCANSAAAHIGQTILNAYSAAGQTLSAASSSCVSYAISLWDGTKALAYDMWHRQAIADELNEASHTYDQANKTLTDGVPYADLHAHTDAYNATIVDAFTNSHTACVGATSTLSRAEEALRTARTAHNSQQTSFIGRLWNSARGSGQDIIAATRAVKTAQAAKTATCKNAAAAQVMLEKTYDAKNIATTYIDAHAKCEKTKEAFSAASTALEAAKSDNQPIPWWNPLGRLWQVSSGPERLQKIRAEQISVQTATATMKKTCKQAEAAALHAKAAAQTTMTRTGRVIDELRTRLGKIESARYNMALGTIATAALGACGIAGIAAFETAATVAVIAKSDKWAKFKNWCYRTLCCKKQSAAAVH
jgi:hypothetical protein